MILFEKTWNTVSLKLLEIGDLSFWHNVNHPLCVTWNMYCVIILRQSFFWTCSRLSSAWGGLQNCSQCSFSNQCALPIDISLLFGLFLKISVIEEKSPRSKMNINWHIHRRNILLNNFQPPSFLAHDMSLVITGYLPSAIFFGILFDPSN